MHLESDGHVPRPIVRVWRLLFRMFIVIEWETCSFCHICDFTSAGNEYPGDDESYPTHNIGATCLNTCYVIRKMNIRKMNSRLLCNYLLLITY